MFSKDSDVISEDAEYPDDYELAIPQLPEIDIASIDVIQPSSEKDASVGYQDIEAAMTAKIKPSGKPRVEGLMGSGVSTTAPMVKNNPTASSNRHAVYTPSTEAPEEEQMEAIWQHIRNSDCESGGTNVRVAIRMRPLNARELELQSRRCMAMVDGCEVIVEDEDATQEHRYNFDFCFDASAPDDDGSAGSQVITFQKLGVEVLTNAWNGYNASLFAYGRLRYLSCVYVSVTRINESRSDRQRKELQYDGK